MAQREPLLGNQAFETGCGPSGVDQRTRDLELVWSDDGMGFVGADAIQEARAFAVNTLHVRWVALSPLRGLRPTDLVQRCLIPFCALSGSTGNRQKPTPNIRIN